MLSAAPTTLRRWSDVSAAVMVAATVAAMASGSLTPLAATGLSLVVPYVCWARSAGRGGPFGRGAANAVTLGRLALVVAGALVARYSLPALGAAALLAFALDGLDGWLARRRGEVDEVGGLFDMETDAFAVLVLTVGLVQARVAGPWLLVAGLLRYVFVLWRWLCAPADRPADDPSPASRGEAPPKERRSRYGRWIFSTLMTSLVAACLPLPSPLRISALAIGTALVCASFTVDFRQVARATWHPRALVFLGLFANVLLFLPGVFFPGGDGSDAFLADAHRIAPLRALHVAAEWTWLVAVCALVARTPLAGVARWLGAAAYTFTLLFLSYHHAYLDFFHRPAAVTSDVRLLVHLFHFISDEPKWGVVLVAFLGVLGGAMAVVASFLRRTQELARAASLRLVFGIVVATTAATASSLAWSGLHRDRPIVHLVARHALINAQTCRVRAESHRVFSEAPPDLRYEPLLRPLLERKPNVHLLMVEAYGEVLAMGDMRAPYEEALSRLASRLPGAAFASTYSRSPVHGGTSWLAISTIQTGVRIQSQPIYEALEAAASHVPSLTAFFRAQGYHTMALQPGNFERAGLRAYDLFGRDTVVDQHGLGYQGPRYGWGVIPDQFSFESFRERYLQAPPSPRFVFFMSVTTHFDWTETPPYAADWRALQSQTPPAETLARSPSGEAIAQEERRLYFRSVDYELQVLGDYITKELDDDALFFIVGDHQPRLDGAGTFRTPVHVISRDQALVERFVSRGFQRGIFAEPGHDIALAHECFFSLVTATLSAHHGGPDDLPIYPEGISVAGLKR